MPSQQRDVFICHASEDKDAIARPLAEALRERGHDVWFDEFELEIGDGLRQEIDRGLAISRFGVVILSPSFFEKKWAQRELDGLTAREMMAGADKVILPVWHEVDHDHVARFSPPLADKLAAKSDEGVPVIVEQIERVLSRDVQGGDSPESVGRSASTACRRRSKRGAGHGRDDARAPAGEQHGRGPREYARWPRRSRAEGQEAHRGALYQRTVAEGRAA